MTPIPSKAQISFDWSQISICQNAFLRSKAVITLDPLNSAKVFRTGISGYCSLETFYDTWNNNPLFKVYPFPYHLFEFNCFKLLSDLSQV